MLTIMEFVSRLRAFGAAIAAMDGDQHLFLNAGEIIRREAQSAMGTYRYGWPRLKDQTIARKMTGDSPLVESGAMRASIKVRVSRGEVMVYSNDQKFVWHEFGTKTIPPRPVFQKAAEAKGYDAALVFHRGVGMVIKNTLG